MPWGSPAHWCGPASGGCPAWRAAWHDPLPAGLRDAVDARLDQWLPVAGPLCAEDDGTVHPDSHRRAASQDGRAPTSVQPFEALHYPLPQETRVRIATSHACVIPRSTAPAIATATLCTIGYISADFVDHQTADLAIATILHQCR
eukprot:281410-Rhodomonas_salina.2